MNLKLKAINEILLDVGLLPVESLDDGDDDANEIIQRLENNLEEFLVEGWYNNTIRKKFSLSESNEIPLGTGVLSVRIDNSRECIFDPDFKITVRDNKLYNINDRTFKFDRPYNLIATYKVDFEDLTPTQRRYVIAITSVKYMGDEVNENGRFKFEKARADVQKEEIRLQDYNAVSHVRNLNIARRGFNY